MIGYVEFFDSKAIGELFHNIRVMLYFVMPILIIWAAIEFGGYLLEVIKGVFHRADEESYDDKQYD
ncbi:hypothetical protein [Paenibacillus alvei]|uniref:hypothetical protein n=1 Tax=Paenibacillus alvei TaxID=44250 RepID=UPI00227D997A|nr:hypothetical protein [Paenibacillus alvei]MCY7486719.1 hypothetical protein [Paenibacillus alvei]